MPEALAAGDPAVLCSDEEMGYRRSRTRFSAGTGLALDEAYRHAHLPLVAPDHTRVIATRPGSAKLMGRHPRVLSLVLPVPGAALEASPAYRALVADLRASLCAPKIAWSLLDRRRDKLHATLCYGLGPARAGPILDAAQRRALAVIGPFAIELRGLYSGDANLGRLYLRLYPERRAGASAVQAVQRALGQAATDRHLVGLFNLTDDLDAAEAASLGALIERWWDRPILRLAVDRLDVLASADDLALDSAIVETAALA